MDFFTIIKVYSRFNDFRIWFFKQRDVSSVYNTYIVLQSKNIFKFFYDSTQSTCAWSVNINVKQFVMISKLCISELLMLQRCTNLPSI
jgi:hypothetical protein